MRTRTTMEFTPRMAQDAETIAEHLDCSTRTEVVRRALMLVADMLAEGQGSTVEVRRPDGSCVRVVF